MENKEVKAKEGERKEPESREAILNNLFFAMNTASNAINSCVVSLMQAYNIPPELMAYVLKDVQLNLEEIKTGVLINTMSKKE